VLLIDASIKFTRFKLTFIRILKQELIFLKETKVRKKNIFYLSTVEFLVIREHEKKERNNNISSYLEIVCFIFALFLHIIIKKAFDL